MTTGSDALSRLVYAAFWDKVQQPRYSEYSLYPLLAGPVLPSCSSSLTSRSSGKRKLHEVTTLKSAVFDLLPESKSSLLEPLLCSWCPYLVRPPAALRRLFEDKDVGLIISLKAQYLCQLLKIERNCVYLDEFLARFESDKARGQALEILLSLLIPRTTDISSDRIEELNGCRILPFRDGALKILRKASDIEKSALQTEWAILPSKNEQEIFAFAQACFVDFRLFAAEPPSTASGHSGAGRRDPLEQLMNADFNIRKMQLKDVGPLLTQSASPLARLDQSLPNDTWFSLLWGYLNEAILRVGSSAMDSWARVNECVRQGSLQHSRIYRVKSGNAWRYIDHEEYQVQPCVITPIDAKQIRLCNEVEGLQLVERRHVFNTMLPVEGNLTNAPSMMRFLRSLQAIEKQSKRPVKASLQSQLSVQSVWLLQELLLQLPSSTKDWTTNPILGELPVWPRQKKNVTAGLGPNLAARDAVFCKHSALLTPWTQGRDQFIDPSFVRNNESRFKHMGFQMEGSSISLPYCRSLDW